MGFGVGVPVDGVEESCGRVGVTDGVVTSVIMDIQGSEGFSRSEHCEFGISGMMVGVVSRVVEVAPHQQCTSSSEENNPYIIRAHLLIALLGPIPKRSTALISQI